MNINPKPLPGHWKEGYALDLHTISSIPIEWDSSGNPTKYETIRTPIGEEMYQLKYQDDPYRAVTIAESAASFLKTKKEVWAIDLIIPIPPSKTTRAFQPVYEIVTHVGRICSLPIDFKVLQKLKPTSQLKEIEVPAERKKILDGAFSIQNNSLSGKNILLFDDLYRSGETLNAVCDIIKSNGKAKNIYVLTVTKTRRNQ